MFGNFSMPELLIVGAIALIVIGPKDLPGMMRSVGKFVGQARGMARQFQRSMDDAAREVDLAEFKQARALMDQKAGANDLSDTLNKTIGLDDADDEQPQKKAMDAAEMAEAAKNFTGGDDDNDNTASKTDATDDAATETVTAVNSGTPEPAKTNQS